MKNTLVLMIALTASIAVSGIGEAEAAKKKLRGSDMTKAQRIQFLDNAQKACRKRFGAPSRVYEIDWYRLKIWCSAN